MAKTKTTEFSVLNRTDGQVTYTLSELNVRRVFAPNEEKQIDEHELETLWQMDGGRELIIHHLFINNEEWVNKHWDAPVEYFWSLDDIKDCCRNDSPELFEETLVYAPQGVREIIKRLSWSMPITDLNKVGLIKKHFNFDPQVAIKIMAEPEKVEAPVKKERLRQRKEK